MQVLHKPAQVPSVSVEKDWSPLTGEGRFSVARLDMEAR